MLREKVESIDLKIIKAMRKWSKSVARFSIFVIFFWFGILKVIGPSPANPLVQSLLDQTLPFLTFSQFIILFGLFEMLIGIVFLIPKLTRLSIALLFFHMITTFLPLVLLTETTWSGFLIPTLEGQYIIKNLIIIALAMSIAAHLKPICLTEEENAEMLEL